MPALDERTLQRFFSSANTPSSFKFCRRCLQAPWCQPKFSRPLGKKTLLNGSDGVTRHGHTVILLLSHTRSFFSSSRFAQEYGAGHARLQTFSGGKPFLKIYVKGIPALTCPCLAPASPTPETETPSGAVPASAGLSSTLRTLPGAQVAALLFQSATRGRLSHRPLRARLPCPGSSGLKKYPSCTKSPDPEF